MVLPMCRPTKHPKTGVYRIRKAVPVALRPVLGWELIENLNTKNAAEAARLAPGAAKRLDDRVVIARQSLKAPVTLTTREVQALCGEWYRAQVTQHEDEPGCPDAWNAAFTDLTEAIQCEPGTYAPQFEPGKRDLDEARAVLAERGIGADEGSIWRFAAALFHAKAKAFVLLERRAEGDYSPDTQLDKFPAYRARQDTKPSLPAQALMKAWSAERMPSPATFKKYAGTFRTIARVLGFDDVRRITVDDVVTFKRHRLEVEKKDTGTVEDDIRSAGTVCKWATKNRLLPINPFDGLAPKAARKLASRLPYEDEDAKLILTAARGETGWLRWAPWLLCFTGARIGELAELRRGDVREDGGVVILDIRPHEVRPGKNDTMQRMIPLHPALIEEGFLAYVETLPQNPSDPLFPSIKADPHGKRDTPAQTKLGRWIRETVNITDPKKAPAHSWRHRMEDELRKVRALPEVQDAITGRYNPRNAGAGYGRGFRGMPSEVLKDLSRVPSPVSAPQPTQPVRDLT